MKIACWAIGKTADAYLEDGLKIYLKRLPHYTSFEWEIIPDIRKAGKLPAEKLKELEGEQILKRLKPDDVLILLDERGKSFTSRKFSEYIAERQNRGVRRIVFQIGGAYGFSPAVYQRANDQIRLSDMTFSHQMIRLFFLEQVYRAMTILRNEPYHND